jgi:signal peptidase I
MRTEDKVMNNGKLQAKQETLKSLHCPSPQSSLFSSRGSSLNTQHSKKSATDRPQHLFIDMSTELLRQGKNVRFRAPGLSMHPTIKEGEIITVVPISSFDIKRGDILLYIVGKKVIAHRVVRIKREKNDSKSPSSTNSSTHASTPSLAHSSTHSSTQASTHSKELNPRHLFILRGDASLTCDDPVEAHQILGKVVSVEKNGHSIDLYSKKAKMFNFAYTWGSRLKRHLARIFSGMRTFNGRHPSEQEFR